MKHLIIVLAVVWVLFQVAGLFWGSSTQPHSQSLTQFAAHPVHRLTEPYRNAYFYLLGFVAAPPLDPAKTGYDMWIEAGEVSKSDAFDYEKPGRSELRIHLTPAQVLPAWDGDDPLESFRGRQSPVRMLVSRYQTLLIRYDRCLGMPFEDWGYGRRAMLRFAEPLILHRLYVADGFSRATTLGLERLYKDLIFWRTVLREAATPATKVMAQVVIQDDVRLLSRILAKPSVDKAILTMGLQLTLPLTPSEYSMRWPIQHQVALAVNNEHPRVLHDSSHLQELDQEQQWLAELAHLPAQAFQKVEHPALHTVIGIPVSSQQTGDIYTAYYEALIKASGPGQEALPRLRQIVGSMRRGMVDGLLNPTLHEPEWDIFFHQLMETDARLRLTSLQIQLRRPSGITAVPTRLAEVGSHYFDPFTGLPMLWSPTQQKLYSVGKDRLDDGGDSSFDITVPAVITSVSIPSKPIPLAPATTRKTS